MIDNIEELYELILQDDEDGVFANSLVESPAIERDFVWLNKEVAFQSVSDEKQLVAGPILVPNKKILRIDGEGSGLGLSIVDAVMKAHGGSVSVSSEIGKGSTFTLFFPQQTEVEI